MENVTNTQQEKEELIDLRAYLNAILKYKWRIALFASMVTAIAILIVLTIPSEYIARATILIESKQAKAVSIEEVYGFDTESKEYYQTQVEILKSENIAEQVIDRLDLVSHPEFDPNYQDESQFSVDIDFFDLFPVLKGFKSTPKAISDDEKRYKDKRLVLRKFQQNLSITPVRKTQLVHISFTSRDPKLAAKIANAIGQVFIESNLEAKLKVANQASSWLNTRMGELKEQLKTSEQKLQQFLESEGLVDVQGVEGLASQELAELTSQLNRARDRRVATETLYSVANSHKTANGGINYSALASVPEISNHPTIQDVKLAEVDAERKVSELSKRYGSKHPKLKSATAELESVRRKLELELKQLLAGINSELSAARRAERSIRAELDGRKREFQTLSVKNAKYNELKREVESNQQLYDMFLSRQKETTASSDFNSTVARFTDEAQAPLQPSKPNRKLLVIFAFVASLGFGCVIALIRDAMNDTFTNEKQVQRDLSLNVLGAVPLIKGKNKLNINSYFNTDCRELSEAIRSVRTGYLLANTNRNSKVVMVTSSIPEEGKTTTSINIAFSLAQMEKTLLIDCDLRKPAIASRFGIKNSHPGVSNLLTQTHDLNDCIYKDETSGLHVLTSGIIPTNPLELLSSSRFQEVLELLKGQYERIVIDTPPCLAVSDALMLSQFSDSAILVVNANQTRTGVVKSVTGKLVQQGVRLDGVVLNKLNVKVASKYEGYHSYHSYYGTEAS